MNRIATDEHVFIAGKTGTGKTRLARAYLSQFPAVAMLDSKGDSLKALNRDQNPWPEVEQKQLTVITRSKYLDNVDTPYLIYAPEFDELDESHYDAFFRWAYFRENITVWVDEAMNISESSQRIPSYYKGILTRGRTKNVAAWSLTQRPMGLHPIIISQCTHVFAFNLPLDQDRKKLVDITGMREFWERPGGHSFWYYRDGEDAAVKGILKI